MQLNLPILDELASCRNLLIAGMGGGFDIFCGLPIYFELRRRGQAVHLANLSFSQTAYLKEGLRLSDTLVGVTAESKSYMPYFPELHLASWFRATRGEEVTIWCFNTQGAQPLLAAYQTLLKHASIDGILLVDGGVDSLMRGDEAEMGTVLEDACSLAAVSQLDTVAVRLIACLGIGAEQDVTYAHVFENMATLAQTGAFLGSCSLVRQMEAYQAYENALEYVHGQRAHDPSVINASIVSAVQGHYGDFHLTQKTQGSRLWISPLMPIYWFFDLQAVAERNLFLPELRQSDTFREALQALVECRERLPERARSRIPLP